MDMTQDRKHALERRYDMLSLPRKAKAEFRGAFCKVAKNKFVT
jgi:hypothetical protein